MIAALSLAIYGTAPALADRTEQRPSAPVEAPPSRISNEPPAPVAPASDTPAAPPSRLQRARTTPGEKLVRTALSMRGYRYRFGGTGKHGFDCSGFVKYLYSKVKGIGIPRTAAQQYHAGQRVARADVKPGDLLFFRSRGLKVGHVGMYIGEGKMVHAANPRRGVTVDKVFGSYWGNRLVGIRRPSG